MNQKDKKLYMIGNAHIDPVWLWQWQEGFQEIKATFRSALDRMKEYPDFVFTSSSAAFYEWIENNDPVMFDEIRERIKEGRWAVVGGWWVEPDCNIPSGESFVRQGLYAQRYFKEKFGVIAHTGYNIDSFGHNAMLPQILKKCGICNYVFMRPGRHEKSLPHHTFEWRSMDGSSVLVFRIPFEYCTWPQEISTHIERCSREIKDSSQAIMCFYGVGNHGGGPTKQNIDSIKELSSNPSYPTLIFASPDMFFNDIRKNNADYHVVEGELLHHASGCYSAHSEIKTLNRKAENRLVMAEKFSTISSIITGNEYPLEEYAKAWKNALFNQFHDILAGTSIESAYEDAREAYGASLHTASVNMNNAVQSLSWRINIPFEEDMKPLVVFNPNSFAGKFEVEIESSNIKENMILVDDRDNPVAFQLVQSQAACNGRCKICFIADLPSMGYRTYRFVKREIPNRFETAACTDMMLENRYFKLEFNKETGAIKSLIKKNDGTEFFSGPAAVPVVIEDDSDTWSHGIRRFNKAIGCFNPVKIYYAEKGPVKSTVRIISEYNKSTIIQDFTLFSELDYILVKTTVDWHEHSKMLKLQFPMNLNYLRTSCEIPYGFIQREPDGEEYPMHSWIDFEGSIPGSKTPCVGLSFLNDGKTSYDADGKTVSITLLRSPIYAHHEPYIPCDDHLYVYQDQGVQRFQYVLYPHDGSWEQAKTIQHAQALNQKPIVLFETYHEGELPQNGVFLEVSEPNVLVGAMKMAEDGSGDVILRLYETVNKKTNAIISLPMLNREIKTTFKPCEIKTLRIPINEANEVKEVNMLEMDQGLC